ncbi:MAG: site-specific integrase [Candidatus Thiodiazotropha taylori]
MATITKRSNRYRVLIRKQNFPTICKTFSDKSTAQTFAKDVEAKMERGLFMDASAAEKTTLNELLDSYSKTILPSKKGKEIEQIRINTLRTALGHYTLSQLQPHIVTKYRDKRLESIQSGTTRRELSLLSTILNTAETDFDIHLPQGNPVSKIRLPKEPKGRTRRLDRQEEYKLLLALKNTIVRGLVELALETALRRSEILRITRFDISFSSRTLYIPKSKTDTPRRIPLSKKATKILHSRLSKVKDGYLWNIKAHSVSTAFRRACKRAGIDDLRFHDLRHEATSRLFEKGLSIMEVSSITGHQDLRMLKRYTHIRPESLVKKLE